jgi:hypothetical protein
MWETNMKRKFLLNGLEVDLLALLRQVVEKLNVAPSVERGGLYHTLRVPLSEYVATLGYTNVPHLLLLMQEIGLLRKWGGGGATVWQVLCITFFDEVVKPVWLERACACLDKRIEMQDEIRVLRAHATGDTPSSPVGTKSLEEIATIVVELEELRRVTTGQKTEIAELRCKLEEQSKVDPDAALAAAIRRARERVT